MMQEDSATLSLGRKRFVDKQSVLRDVEANIQRCDRLQNKLKTAIQQHGQSPFPRTQLGMDATAMAAITSGSASPLDWTAVKVKLEESEEVLRSKDNEIKQLRALCAQQEKELAEYREVELVWETVRKIQDDKLAQYASKFREIAVLSNTQKQEILLKDKEIENRDSQLLHIKEDLLDAFEEVEAMASEVHMYESQRGDEYLKMMHEEISRIKGKGLPRNTESASAAIVSPNDTTNSAPSSGSSSPAADEKRIADLQIKCYTLSIDLNAKSREISSLKSALESAMANVDKQSMEADDLTRVLEEEKVMISKKLKRIQKALDEAMSTADRQTVETEEAKKELTRTVNQVNTLQRALSASQHQVTMLTSRLTCMESERSDTRGSRLHEEVTRNDNNKRELSLRDGKEGSVVGTTVSDEFPLSEGNFSSSRSNEGSPKTAVTKSFFGDVFSAPNGRQISDKYDADAENDGTPSSGQQVQPAAATAQAQAQAQAQAEDELQEARFALAMAKGDQLKLRDSLRKTEIEKEELEKELEVLAKMGTISSTPSGFRAGSDASAVQRVEVAVDVQSASALGINEMHDVIEALYLRLESFDNTGLNVNEDVSEQATLFKSRLDELERALAQCDQAQGRLRECTDDDHAAGKLSTKLDIATRYVGRLQEEIGAMKADSTPEGSVPWLPGLSQIYSQSVDNDEFKMLSPMYSPMRVSPRESTGSDKANGHAIEVSRELSASGQRHTVRANERRVGIAETSYENSDEQEVVPAVHVGVSTLVVTSVADASATELRSAPPKAVSAISSAAREEEGHAIGGKIHPAKKAYVEELDSEVSDAGVKEQALHRDLKEANAKIEYLESQLANTPEKERTSRRQIAELRSKVMDLESDLTVAQQSLQNLEVVEKKKFEVQNMQKLQKDAGLIADKERASQRQIAALESRVKDLESDLSAARQSSKFKISELTNSKDQVSEELYLANAKSANCEKQATALRAKVTELESDLSVTRDEIKSSKSRLKESAGQLADFESSLETLKTADRASKLRIAELQGRIADLESDAQRTKEDERAGRALLEEARNEAMVETTSLQERVASSTEQAASLQVRVGDLESDLTLANESLQRNQKKLASAESRAEELEDMLSHAQTAAKSSKERAAELQGRVSDLECDLVAAREESRTHRMRLTETEQKAADEFQEAEKQAKLSKVKAEELLSRMSDMEYDLTAAREALKSEQIRLTSAMNRAEDLDQALVTAQVESRASRTQVTEMQGRAMDLEADLATERRESNNSRVRAAEAESRAMELDDLLRESRQQVQSLSVRLSESEDKEHQTASELATNKQALHEVTSEFVTTEERVADLEGVLSRVRIEASATAKELAKELEGRDETIAEIQAALDEMRKNFASKSSEVVVSKGRLSEIESDLNISRQRISSLTEQLKESQSDMSGLEIELTSGKAYIKQLELRVAESEGRATDLESDLQDSRTKVSDCGKEIVRLESGLDDLQMALNDSTNEVKRVAGKLAEVTARKDDLEADASALQERHRDLISKNAEMQAQISHSETRVSELEHSAAESTATLASTSSRLRDAESKREDLSDKLRIAEAALASTESQLASAAISLSAARDSAQSNQQALSESIQREGDLRIDIDRLQVEYETQREALDLSKHTVTKLLSESEHEKSEYATLLMTLQEAKQALTTQGLQAEQDRDAAEAQMQTLKNSLAKTSKEASTNAHRLADEEAKVAALTESLAKVKLEYGDLLEVKADTDLQVSTLKGRLSGREKDLLTAQEDLKALSAQVAESDVRASALKVKLSARERDLDKVRDEANLASTASTKKFTSQETRCLSVEKELADFRTLARKTQKELEVTKLRLFETEDRLAQEQSVSKKQMGTPGSDAEVQTPSTQQDTLNVSNSSTLVETPITPMQSTVLSEVCQIDSLQESFGFDDVYTNNRQSPAMTRNPQNQVQTQNIAIGTPVTHTPTSGASFTSTTLYSDANMGLELEMSALKGRINGREKDLLRAHAEVETLTMKNVSAQKQVTKLEYALVRKDEQLAEAEAAIESVREENQVLKYNLSKVSVKYDMIQQERLEGTGSMSCSSSDSSSPKALKALKGASQSRDSEKCHMDTLRQSLALARGQKDESEARERDLMQRLSEANSELERLRSKIERLLLDRNRAVQDSEELREKITRVDDECLRMHSQVLSMDREKKSITAIASSVASTLTEAESGLQSLASAINCSTSDMNLNSSVASPTDTHSDKFVQSYLIGAQDQLALLQTQLEEAWAKLHQMVDSPSRSLGSGSGTRGRERASLIAPATRCSPDSSAKNDCGESYAYGHGEGEGGKEGEAAAAEGRAVTATPGSVHSLSYSPVSASDNEPSIAYDNFIPPTPPQQSSSQSPYHTHGTDNTIYSTTKHRESAVATATSPLSAQVGQQSNGVVIVADPPVLVNAFRELQNILRDVTRDLRMRNSDDSKVDLLELSPLSRSAAKAVKSNELDDLVGSLKATVLYLVQERDEMLNTEDCKKFARTVSKKTILTASSCIPEDMQLDEARVQKLEKRLRFMEKECLKAHEMNSVLQHEVAVLETEMNLMRAQEEGKVQGERELRMMAEGALKKAESDFDALVKEYVAYKVDNGNTTLELEKHLHSYMQYVSSTSAAGRVPRRRVSFSKPTAAAASAPSSSQRLQSKSHVGGRKASADDNLAPVSPSEYNRSRKGTTRSSQSRAGAHEATRVQAQAQAPAPEDPFQTPTKRSPSPQRPSLFGRLKRSLTLVNNPGNFSDSLSPDSPS